MLIFNMKNHLFDIGYLLDRFIIFLYSYGMAIKSRFVKVFFQ
jgi:hypothetical protein